MKILQGFLVFMFLAKSSDAECDDVYIVNRKNLPTKRCMALSERDERGPGWLMRLEDCTDAPAQKFRIDFLTNRGGEETGLFYIESDAASQGNGWDTAYMRRGRESGEMEVPSRMRLDTQCHDCIIKFRLDKVSNRPRDIFHYIEVDGYDNDYCITGAGADQKAGKQIIVHNCAEIPDLARYEWYITRDLDDNEAIIVDPINECS
uniref:Ricin B lectin domain-containing protein n=1 Tax=Helicotheca tamesis TaxID=374047 RepID=A0A7S2HUN4_9STRA|mmetsp:Transcript_2808/g.3857  ORF Transcript_2808/g.3857 Transcript_2808/m.3857 type:complete len:205 (+) Transcript_2808:50-664(+)